MKEIDLYSEAKPLYYQLIPNKEDGLIILALYQKHQNQEFTEDQIIQIIRSGCFGAKGREQPKQYYHPAPARVLSVARQEKKSIWI